MLGDEEPAGDLVGAEMLVEQQEDLQLAGGQPVGDRLRYTSSETAAFADTLEKSPCDRTGQGGFATGDAAKELCDSFRRLALEQVAGCAGANCRQQVLFGSGCRQDYDLGARGGIAHLRERGQTVHLGHRQVEQDEVRLKLTREHDRLGTATCLADDVEIVLRKERREGLAGQRMVVDDENALLHEALIGKKRPADESDVQTPNPSRAEAYRSWLIGELVLVALLGGAIAYFTVTSSLRGYALPEARLALDTTVAVCASIVATLAAIRFLVEGRALDVLLAASFVATGLGTLAFGVVPTLGGRPLGARDTWMVLAAQIVAAAAIAVAPFVGRRFGSRTQILAGAGIATVAALVCCWLVVRAADPTRLTSLDGSRTFSLTAAFAALALLGVVAVVGFGLRYRRHGRDLDSWLTLALTLTLFAELHYVVSPVLSNRYVLPGDFLRLLSYGVLLVGVWRAISEAEFGRAVSDERARVAREIHDGLAQYLFALSTHVSMLESGAALDELLPRMKVAAVAAQQEARFAVLALSSASGTAPFDAGLRRYVEFLTADGELDVELEIDPAVVLAPDEQIEVFRIVQEGLANVHRHAGAKRAHVTIGRRSGRRVVRVEDDGRGFEDHEPGAGQGLQNMRRRAAAIEGGFRLLTAPGRGTALEVTLRG